MARNYTSISEAKTLTANVTNVATQITLNNVTSLPSPPYVLVLSPDTASEEVILVNADQTGVISPTLNVTRAIETGAIANTHTNGNTVKHMIVGSDLQSTQDHIDNTTTAHGATGAVVGTTNTQTLTNKTLTTPKINEDVTLTATSTELNVLDGIPATLTATELGYVDGVTSAIQTQIDTKAPLASPTFTGTPLSTTAATGTNTTQIATTAFVQSTVAIPVYNAQTGTTYTFVLADAGDIVTSSNAGTVVMTIPPNSSVAYPIGASITVISIGAGLTNFAQGAGVTINSTGAVATAPVLRIQHSSATAIKVDTDTWQVVGDIS